MQILWATIFSLSIKTQFKTRETHKFLPLEKSINKCSKEKLLLFCNRIDQEIAFSVRNVTTSFKRF